MNLGTNTILISLGISAIVTMLSVSLEYALTRRPPGTLAAQSEAIKSELRTRIADDLSRWGQPEISYSYGTSFTVAAPRQKCDYCKTAQTAGDHCRNCGAPL